jgi:hypothetical protein
MNKSNRFNLLFKDATSTTTIKKVDRFNNNNNNNNNNQINRFVSKQVNDERNKKKQTDNFIKSLDSLTEFPELQMKKKESIVLNNNNNNKSTFMDAIKTNNLTNEINSIEIQNEENVPPGCVCIKIDKTTNSHNWSYGDSFNESSKNKYEEKVVMEENPYFVFQRVNDLYNNRKNEHIKKWGFEEYDQMFMFQNYDYGYFDRLDDEQNEKYSKKISVNYYN